MLGFYEIIPWDAMQYFDISEFGIMLSGLKTIDIDDMKQFAVVEDDDLVKSETLEWFWEVLKEFDEGMKAKFLFFVTGSFKVPFGGFKNQKLILTKSYA